MTTAKSSLDASQEEKRTRVSFSKIPPAMELPNLISVQKESFERFMTEGLAESFAEFSPIQNSAGTMEVTFGDHTFGEPAHTIAECRAKDISYQAPLFVYVRFVNKETGEIKEQLVFVGDFPLMTKRGTFIINGTERVVVSQLVRSPSRPAAHGWSSRLTSGVTWSSPSTASAASLPRCSCAPLASRSPTTKS